MAIFLFSTQRGCFSLLFPLFNFSWKLDSAVAATNTHITSPSFSPITQRMLPCFLCLHFCAASSLLHCGIFLFLSHLPHTKKCLCVSSLLISLPYYFLKRMLSPILPRLVFYTCHCVLSSWCIQPVSVWFFFISTSSSLHPPFHSHPCSCISSCRPRPAYPAFMLLSAGNCIEVSHGKSEYMYASFIRGVPCPDVLAWTLSALSSMPFILFFP